MEFDHRFSRFDYSFWIPLTQSQIESFSIFPDTREIVIWQYAQDSLK